ncbi:MAG: stage II sporulation protein M [Staphylothermus sp.]|nr:stage II sporulation protein M [Staphylothermus sp.]
MNIEERTLSGLEKLISIMKFEKEKILPHIIPGIMLFISLPAYASVLYNVYLGNYDPSNLSSLWYTRLATLYIGYILSSSYSIYRIYKLLHRHLIDSGIISYYWLKKINDIDSITKLYKAGLFKRELPSSITVFLITLLSGGLAYPIFLYIAEKNLRNHAYGEETKFINRHITNLIGIEHGLLFFAATILTMGLYLAYWGYRAINVYNKHIEIIHRNHPELPQPQYSVSIWYEDNIPVLLLALVFSGIVFYGLAGLIGLPCYLPSVIGYGALLGYVALRHRYDSFSKQVLLTYAFIYVAFLSTAAIGFIDAPVYTDFYKTIQEQLSSMHSYDFFNLTLNIFFNNLGISIVAISPLIGSIYMGLGLGNSGLMYGIALTIGLLKGDLSLLALPIMPHAILELFAYSIFIVVSTRIVFEETRKILNKLLFGIIVLLLAAVVESLLIVS